MIASAAFLPLTPPASRPAPLLAKLPSLLLVAGVLGLPGAGFAQPATPAPAVLAPPAAKVATSGPAWASLTPAQQQALMPLASSWNTSISEPQKRKWLEISKNYGSLPPDGQATMHSRMNEWVMLSPQQRAQARLNFATTKELSKQLTPEEKKTKWESYQALSPEEKEKLAAKASPKPGGAATAVKPVAPQKLVAVPPPAGKPAPKITAPQPSAADAVPVDAPTQR